MATPTQINFINQNSRYDLIIAPANSSKGRWNSFTLKPGKIGQVSDSNPGKGNYDVEFTASFKQLAPKKDILIGTFRFDNPWLSPANMASTDRYIGFVRPTKIGNVKYLGSYIGSTIVPGRGEGYIAGSINTKGLAKKDDINKAGGDYFSRMPYTAFVPGEPVANIKYLKGNDVRYNFWASLDPNPGLFN